MDMALAVEKLADRVFLIGVLAGALWWASRHDATAKVEELGTKLDNVISQVNQGFQQVQGRVTTLEGAKPAKSGK